MSLIGLGRRTKCRTGMAVALPGVPVRPTASGGIAKIKEREGTDFRLTTLRHIVLQLKKFPELQGRRVKFLTDVQFKSIRDTTVY